MGHVTTTILLSGTVCHWWAGTSYDQAVTLCNKFKISTLTRYEDMKGDKIAEIGVVWSLGVTQGHQQHSHSIQHIGLAI